MKETLDITRQLQKSMYRISVAERTPVQSNRSFIQSRILASNADRIEKILLISENERLTKENELLKAEFIRR